MRTYPFIDRKAVEFAGKFDLPRTAKSLARYAEGPKSYVRLVDGLVRKGFDA